MLAGGYNICCTDPARSCTDLRRAASRESGMIFSGRKLGLLVAGVDTQPGVVSLVEGRRG
jgi:hypothetical protein